MPLIEVRGVELHYTDTGSGPVALFVHGFPLDGTVWSDQVERLGGEGRRRVVPDLAGFGRSAPVITASLGMERHADDLAGLLDALDVDRVDLVGLSMGGYVALAFAERHPARLRTMALVDTKATADTPEGKAGRDAAVARLLDGGRAAFAAEMATVLLGPDAGPMVHARVRQMIESTRYETIVAALIGLRDRATAPPSWRRARSRWPWWSGNMTASTPPAAAEAMVALRDDATLHVVPGVGHLTPIEAPDAVAGVLQAVFDRGA